MITGNFLVIDNQAPEVRIGEAIAVVTDTQNCVDFEGVTNVQSCTRLTVSLPAGSLRSGEHSVVVKNPYAAACIFNEDVKLTIIFPPEMTAIEPNHVCTAQSNMEIQITGTGFCKLVLNLQLYTWEVHCYWMCALILVRVRR